MISVVVVSLNEGEKLARALESINKLASEIVVIDLESTDNTSEVARSFKAKLIKHPKVPYVEELRELAIKSSTKQWVLILDPDEVVSVNLAERIQEFIKQDSYCALNIPRKNIFFGQWIAHTNFWPDYQIRLFKRGFVSWPKIIHTYPIIDGKTLKLPPNPEVAIEHYGYDDWLEFSKRQRRYARVEAENLKHQGKSFNLINLIWKPMREFLVRFVKHQAYLDGWIGIRLVLGLMWYRILVEINLLKLEK